MEGAGHPPIFDEATQFFKNLFDYTLPISKGNLQGWRTRAKLAVRGTWQQPKVGLFKMGTHDTVDIPYCQVHHPAINKVADLVREWIVEERIEPYQENGWSGELRYLQLSVERSTNTVQLVLIVNMAIRKASIEKLVKKTDGLLNSLWINYNSARSNLIWGDKWEQVSGQEWLVENFIDQKYFFHPGAFLQANSSEYEELLKDLNREILPHKKVVEYYAGVGVIGLSVLAQSQELNLSEFNKEGRSCFEENKKRRSTDEQMRCTYHEMDARKGISLLPLGEVVIVDPPRKGVEAALLEKMITSDTLEQLIYVSCGWPAFKRESQVLQAQGFKLQFAKGYLFFPGTDQLEILAVFNRS